MSDDREPIVERVPARAALAGNPSDGYGGAVLAIPVRGASATVTLRAADRFEIAHSATDDDTFTRWDDLRGHLDRFGSSGRRELVMAAIDAYSTILSPEPFEPCRIDVATTIPRAVGLAGSSAIVIATLRALARHAGDEAPGPDRLAIVALAAEVEHLGIAAGLQDRVVQSYDAPVHMEFGPEHRRTVEGRPAGSYEVVTPHGSIRLLVAHLPAAAAPSGSTHRPLRERFAAGDGDVGRAMTALAQQARLATTAFRAGDVATLGAAMDRSFDIRRSILPLVSAQVEMVERTRAAGGAANFCGSGGSISVLAVDDGTEERVRASLAELGCGFIALG